MEQPEEIGTNQDEREIETGDVETKEHENTNIRPRRSSAGKVVEHLEMKFGGETHDTQFATNRRCGN